MTGPHTPERNNRPDIFLVTADSLRADRLGCYGAQQHLSPNLDQLARRSDVFLKAISDGPNTPHAFPAIMSSRSSLRSRKLGLFDAPCSLAEFLRKQGYYTMGVNAGNPYVSRHFCYDRGFLDFHDYIHFDASPSSPRSEERSEGILSVPALDPEHYMVTRKNMRAKAQLEMQLIGNVLDRLTSMPQQPFFLWLHLMDTHYPYVPQKLAQEIAGGAVIPAQENLRLNTLVREGLSARPENLQRIWALYDACVVQTDDKVGQLMAFLEERSLFDEALIIFCADHGEEFLEHGDFQHKSKLFDELVRVPLLLKLPKQQYGHRHERCVSLLQIAPTIAQLTDFPHPFQNDSLFDPAPEGEMVFSAASVGPNGGTPVDKAMFRTDRLPKIFSVRTRTGKFIMTPAGEKWCFDLIQDGGETRNTCAESPSEAAGLEKILKAYICDLEELRVRESVLRNHSDANAERGFVNAI